MESKLNAPWIALRFGIGLMAALAGLDKFFNLLADWSAYVGPLAAQALPFSPHTFMAIVGVIEFAVGAAILAGWTRLGAYVASVWLVGVAVNLVTGGFIDIAVRDLVLSIAAFTLARLAEVRREAPVYAFNDVVEQTGRTLTA
jgi:DoxX-like protein